MNKEKVEIADIFAEKIETKIETKEERKKRKKREWYHNNKDKCDETARKYRKNNKDNIKEIKRKWYEKNQKEIRKKQRKYQDKNRDKIRETNRLWGRKNRGKVWEQRLEREYGLTLDDYDKMLKEQNCCCAICGRHKIIFKLKLAVDHCHKTGKIRGLLCGCCNTSLGRFKDNINTFKKAIEYLEKNE